MSSFSAPRVPPASQQPDEASADAPFLAFLATSERPSPFLWSQDNYSSFLLSSSSSASSGSPNGAHRPDRLGTPQRPIGNAVGSLIPPEVMAAFQHPTPQIQQSRRPFALENSDDSALPVPARPHSPELPQLLSALTVDNVPTATQPPTNNTLPASSRYYSPSKPVGQPFPFQTHSASMTLSPGPMGPPMPQSPSKPRPTSTAATASVSPQKPPHHQRSSSSQLNASSQEFVPFINGGGGGMGNGVNINSGLSTQLGQQSLYRASPPASSTLPTPFPAAGSSSPWGASADSHGGRTIPVVVSDDHDGNNMRRPVPVPDTRKKREHVSVPSSPLSPPLVDHTRSLPNKGFEPSSQRRDSATMKRRKLDFGEEQASPVMWREAAAGPAGSPPKSTNYSPPKAYPSMDAGSFSIMPYPAHQMQYARPQHMNHPQQGGFVVTAGMDYASDYLNAEVVDLGDVVVGHRPLPSVKAPTSTAIVDCVPQYDMATTHEPPKYQGPPKPQKLKQSVRQFLKELNSRSKSGYLYAKTFALNLPPPGLAAAAATAGASANSTSPTRHHHNDSTHSSPERRSNPPSPISGVNVVVALRDMPGQIRSQVCLELADLAKRESEFSQARMFFRASTQLDPLNAKAWLEYAKCEEENGHLHRAQRILLDGFRKCCTTPYSHYVDRVSRESIVLRMLRLFSRTDAIHGVRTIIGEVLAHYNRQEYERTGSMGRSEAAAMWAEEFPAASPGSNPSSPTRTSQFGASTSPLKGNMINSYMMNAQPQKYPQQQPQYPPIATPVIHGEDDNAFPWRIIMEGANLEWKFGRRKLAHSIMEYLHRVIPSRAQPYMFASDLFKKEGRYADAYRIIMAGIQNLPSAGMLYFEALQLLELIATQTQSASSPPHDTASVNFRGGHSRNSSMGSRTDFLHLDMEVDSNDDAGSNEAMDVVMDDVQSNISSGSMHRAHAIRDPFCTTHKSYSWTLRELIDSILPVFTERALANLSPELVWKFHVEVSSLLERADEASLARQSLLLCERSIPDNLTWKVWLHGARIELAFGREMVGRKLLMQAFNGVPKKMQAQVLLEWAHFEEILQNRDQARYILQQAIEETQNDWKVMLELVLLELRAGNIDQAIKAAKEALAIHPSTGRLWSVLIQLEHLKNYNDPRLAAPFAVFKEALQEVPKSGEVWCEGARLAIHVGMLDEARKFLDFSLHFTPQYGDSLIEYLRLDILTGAATQGIQSKLYRICAHAEPDYGPVWAFCKQSPLENGLEAILFKNAMKMLLSLPVETKLDISTHLATLDFNKLTMSERRRILFG